MAPLATSVELPFFVMHRYRGSFLPTCSSLHFPSPISLHALEFAPCWCACFWLVLRILFLVDIMSSSHSAWEVGMVPIGYMILGVEDLLSSFTRVALLRPGEWIFPSPPFTHHCFIAAHSSWCIPAPRFGPVGWDDVVIQVVAQFQGGWWMERLSMEERHWRLHSSLAHNFFFEREERRGALEFSWGFGAASVEELFFFGVLGVWQLEEHSHGHCGEGAPFLHHWLPYPSVVLRGPVGSLIAAGPVGSFQVFGRPNLIPTPLLHRSRDLPSLPAAHRGRATPL
eukprot:Gb_34581 [translate_table: standard]